MRMSVTQAVTQHNKIRAQRGPSSAKKNYQDITDLQSLSSLKSLTVLLPNSYEIIVFAKANKLRAGTWALSLDTISEQFRQEMGQSRENVTWRVIVGHDPQFQTPLCELLSLFPLDYMQWWVTKAELGMEDPKVGHIWKRRVSQWWDKGSMGVAFNPLFNSQHPLPKLTEKKRKAVDNGDSWAYSTPSSSTDVAVSKPPPSTTTSTKDSVQTSRLLALPPEIRMMIWRYCLDVKRTVILDYNFYCDGNIPRAEILEDCPASFRFAKKPDWSRLGYTNQRPLKC